MTAHSSEAYSSFVRARIKTREAVKVVSMVLEESDS